MAGLSDVIFVIEAGEKSGTLITSRLGTEYNKEVCTIPHPIFSSGAKGGNQLLRLGATPITSSEDLLEVLGFQTDTFSGQQEIKISDCSPEEIHILKILTDPLSKDDLIQKSQKPISEMNTLLSIMEIKGLIKESLGEIRRV
jgi:DNA processing protein